eukprot:COSAG01_NODE_3283_length_6310_cov_8.652391_8_plen_48_part_00
MFACCKSSVRYRRVVLKWDQFNINAINVCVTRMRHADFPLLIQADPV